MLVIYIRNYREYPAVLDREFYRDGNKKTALEKSGFIYSYNGRQLWSNVLVTGFLEIFQGRQATCHVFNALYDS